MPDTVVVEEERDIAPPNCTIMPPPECEPRRAEVPGAEEGPRAMSRSPIQRTHPSVRSARQSVLHQWRGWCSAVSAVRCGSDALRCEVEACGVGQAWSGRGVEANGVVWYGVSKAHHVQSLPSRM